jgi:hypothetical protein
MDKERIASVSKQLGLIALVYPACLVALLSAVTAYLEPPFVWVVGLFSWAAFTVLFMRYALGVKLRRTVTSPLLRMSGRKR